MRHTTDRFAQRLLTGAAVCAIALAIAAGLDGKRAWAAPDAEEAWERVRLAGERNAGAA